MTIRTLALIATLAALTTGCRSAPEFDQGGTRIVRDWLGARIYDGEKPTPRGTFSCSQEIPDCYHEAAQ